jgi:hypothetical protein
MIVGETHYREGERVPPIEVGNIWVTSADLGQIFDYIEFPVVASGMHHGPSVSIYFGSRKYAR